MQEEKSNSLDLRHELEVAMRRDNTSLRDMARQLGLSASILAGWMNGKGSDECDALVRAWLGERRVASARPAPEPFIETPSASRFCSVFAYAQAFGRMSVVCGGPGLGKTRSIRHYRELYPDVWVATCSPMVSGLVPALEEIAEACGITNAGGGARQIARSIARKVEVAPRGLLILDEAQHLTIGAVEAVRAIHDETQLGVAFVGNEAVVRFGGKAQHAHFAQISSRLGMRVFVSKPTLGDVGAVASHFGVTDKPALELLGRLSGQPGALRSVAEVIKLAKRASDGPVTADHVWDAIEHLGGEA